MWLAAGSTARAPNRHRWLSRCAQPRRQSARGPRRSGPRRVCRLRARAPGSDRPSVPRSVPPAEAPGLRRRRAGKVIALQTPPEFGAAAPNGRCPPPRTGNCATSGRHRGEPAASRSLLAWWPAAPQGWRESSSGPQTRQAGPQSSPVRFSPVEQRPTRWPRPPGQPHTAAPGLSIRAPREGVHKGAEERSLRFRSDLSAAQALGALNRRPSGNRLHLHTRRPLGRLDFGAGGAGDLLGLFPGHGPNALRFCGPLALCRRAEFGHFLPQSLQFFFGLLELTLGFRSRGGRLGQGSRDGGSAPPEERRPIFGNQIAQAAEHQEEVQPAKQSPNGRFRQVRLASLSPQGRRRPARKNKKTGKCRVDEPPRRLHRTSLMLWWATGRRSRMTRAISSASVSLANWISARAATRSAEIFSFAARTSSAARLRALRISAARSSRTARRAASCSA